MWTSCTIKVIGTKLSAEFDYAPWMKVIIVQVNKWTFFEYKYLGKQPANEKETRTVQGYGGLPKRA